MTHNLSFSVYMMNSCPYASLMANTMDSRQWTVNEMISSLKCYSCFHNVVNTWAPCVRRSAQVNLHPSLTSRCRQIWFLVMQLLKYCNPIAQFDSDENFEFLGENTIQYHMYSPTDPDRRKLNPEIPKIYQTAKIVSRGKFIVTFITIGQASLTANLGNEVLVRSCGFFPGACILYNTGLASHGGGANRGMSKALAMVAVLLMCPGDVGKDINWCLAWTAICVLDFKPYFQPILASIAMACDSHFWV